MSPSDSNPSEGYTVYSDTGLFFGPDRVTSTGDTASAAPAIPSDDAVRAATPELSALVIEEEEIAHDELSATAPGALSEHAHEPALGAGYEARAESPDLGSVAMRRSLERGEPTRDDAGDRQDEASATPEMTLHHASLLYQNPESLEVGSMSGDEIEAYVEARHDFLVAFSEGGGKLVEDTGDSATHAAFFTEDTNHYTMDASGEQDQQIYEAIPDGFAGIRKPQCIDAVEATASGSHLPLPYVLAFRDQASGYGKYLIETLEQQQQTMSFLRIRSSGSEAERRSVKDAEERTFIETPSDRYTSYRLVYDTSGQILAAGLLLSSHTKDNGKVIESFAEPLESRDSDFYLGSRDIRSNLGQGGRVIPLMGAVVPVTDKATRAVLIAHGIDPEHPRVPEELKESANELTRTYGRPAGLLIAWDVLQSTSGERYLSEGNSGSRLGMRTYAACYPHRNPGDMYREVYQRILRGIAIRVD